MKKTSKTIAVRPQKTGLTVKEFCAGSGISNSTYYGIPPGDKPKQITIGSKVIILESPADWLARIAKRGKGIALTRYQRKKPDTAAAA